MKALVITPKNDNEFKFLIDLFNKLGIVSSALSKDELEDIGMSKLMRGIDKTKKASRTEIMKSYPPDESRIPIYFLNKTAAYNPSIIITSVIKMPSI